LAAPAKWRREALAAVEQSTSIGDCCPMAVQTHNLARIAIVTLSRLALPGFDPWGAWSVPAGLPDDSSSGQKSRRRIAAAEGLPRCRGNPNELEHFR
jgi:hypothetical protein